ncbi:DUF3047 domain-containing protein [Enterovibrio paralichthyis]|uniref:DUF3047 domain-containing protein n=1 Tax=Enterovibrio paralichthyis TaxID=2853805 RepID=UPI001C4507C7|nr:DUF3047 domain-containing protein [Enterovibrio paralichthyis]MBV7296331.1 DUF3047 domain-containing protein [Enterovibrio paralichthyis]
MKNGLYLFMLASFFSYSSETVVELPKFTEEELPHWEMKIFSGETFYQALPSENILKAQSNCTASGLMFKQKIDLQKTPYLNWSWKISNKLPPLSQRTKKGDDYAARIYLIIHKGFFPWSNKALNYVWSGSNNMGEHWNNPYAGEKVKMLAVRDADSEVNVWYAEKRNVYQDLITLFGDEGSEQANLKSYQYIDVVALMTDTDDSSSSVESYYGPISFSSE